MKLDVTFDGPGWEDWLRPQGAEPEEEEGPVKKTLGINLPPPPTEIR